MNKIIFVTSILSFFLFYSCNKDEDSYPKSVRDIDGNVYKTIKIGDQIWMAENLKVTHFNNGEPLQFLSNPTPNPQDIKSPTYFYPEGRFGYYEIYGALYDINVVRNSRNICPHGWHVPDAMDFGILIEFLGGCWVAHGKLKEAGMDHWLDPNVGATNESGFTGLPAGFIRDGKYRDFRSRAVFLSTIEKQAFLLTTLSHNNGGSPDNSVEFYVIGFGGASIRCIKNK